MTAKAMTRILLSLAAMVIAVGPVMASDLIEVDLAPGYKDIIFEDSMWTTPYTDLEKSKAYFIPEDYKFDIAPAPANDSPETLEELRTLFKYATEKRTPEQVQKIKDEQDGVFRDIKLGLGQMITPETQKKLDDLQATTMFELDHFLYAIKREYKRARPNQLAPKLETVIHVPGSASYPSGHSGNSMLIAQLYAYIDPANKDKYVQLADEASLRRQIGGIHYPSDCEAGQQLAIQVFNKLLEHPEYRAQIDEVKALFETGYNTQALRFTDDMWTDEIREIAALEPRYLNKYEAFTLDPAPANDSETTRQDLATMHKYSDERTEEQIKLINEEAHEWKALTLDPSVNVTPEARQKIIDLVNQAVTDHGYFSFIQKKYYKRARPHQVDPSIKPVIDVPAHPAYPSGHGGQTHIAALVFSTIDPSHKDFYMSLARDIGVRREIAGVHYPSDTKAGIQLAEQVYTKLMENPEFKSQVDEMKAAVENATH